jgi:hypothetical protein
MIAPKKNVNNLSKKPAVTQKKPVVKASASK